MWVNIIGSAWETCGVHVVEVHDVVEVHGEHMEVWNKGNI